MMIQSTSISPRKEQSREGARKGRNTAGCWCFSAEPLGRTLGAEWSAWLSCWAAEIRALLHGKRQSCSSSRSSMHHGKAALKGKPSKPNLSLQFSARIISALQSLKGWTEPCTTSQVHNYTELRHWARQRDVWPFYILLHFLFQSGFLGFLAGKCDWVARVLLRLTSSQLQLHRAAQHACPPLRLSLLPFVPTPLCVTTQWAKPGIRLVMNEGKNQTKRRVVDPSCLTPHHSCYTSSAPMCEKLPVQACSSCS